MRPSAAPLSLLATRVPAGLNSSIDRGVQHIFGLCGHTNIAFLAALSKSEKIKFINVRHEQIASHAADGYARVTKKASVVLSTLGPGIMNNVTGVATAALDSIPMVVIAGDVQSYYFGKHPHQEVNQHADGSQCEIDHDDGEIGLAARGAIGDHRHRAGGLDRGQGGVAPGRIFVDPFVIGGKRALHGGQLNRGGFRFLADKGHDFGGKRAPFFTAVGQLHLDEHVMHAHDAQPDLAGLLGHLGNLGDGETVAVDDVIEETDREAGGGPQPLPIDQSLTWSQRVARGEYARVVSEAEAIGIDTVLGASSLADVGALADAARFVGKGAIASRALHTIRTRFPGTARAASAAFVLGRTAEDAGQSASAMSWYDTYLAEAPGGALAPEALGRRMLALRRMGNTAAAKQAAEAYLQRFPHGPYSGVAREMTAP